MTIDVENFAIVTPSYHRDYEPCRLLVDSVNRYVDNKIKHYLIVPKSDYCLFQHLESSRTIVVFQEDFLPWWILPTVLSKKWSLSLKTLPVRGWIRQQIIKLSIGEILPESVYLLIDSDTFLVKKFELDNFFKGKSVSHYCETAKRRSREHDNWQKVSAKILKLDNYEPTSNYNVAPFLFWKKDILQKMFRTIESKNKMSWQRALCGQLRMSEYTLYGVFVSHVLGLENSGHFRDPLRYTYDGFSRTPMSISELERFKNEMEPHHIGASITSKSSTRLNDIRRVFGY